MKLPRELEKPPHAWAPRTRIVIESVWGIARAFTGEVEQPVLRLERASDSPEGLLKTRCWQVPDQFLIQ